MNNAEEELLKNNSENVWKRAKEVTNNSSEMKYFPVKIEESQLEPSDFGEALMSVLTLMPESLS